MQLKTSTNISSAKAQEIEQRLRKAAAQANHEKFWPSGEKLEIVNGTGFKSVEAWAKEAKSSVNPEGDPTLCYLAYQAALALCGGDDIREAAAYAAYQYCLQH